MSKPKPLSATVKLIPICDSFQFTKASLSVNRHITEEEAGLIVGALKRFIQNIEEEYKIGC